MSTFAEVQKAAEPNVVTAVDDDTPAGYFTATTKIAGMATTYLLAGVEGDLDAEIVGRIEWPDLRREDELRLPNIYSGTGLKGGQPVSPTGGSAEAFAAIAARAR